VTDAAIDDVLPMGAHDDRTAGSGLSDGVGLAAIAVDGAALIPRLFGPKRANIGMPHINAAVESSASPQVRTPIRKRAQEPCARSTRTRGRRFKSCQPDRSDRL
jgi:hypothetical protein